MDAAEGALRSGDARPASASAAAPAYASAIPGVDMVELNTARWSETGTRAELHRLAHATERGVASGLAIAAGHGLTLQNLRPLVLAAPGIEEYNIGHALISDAVFLGLHESVRRYLELLE